MVSGAHFDQWWKGVRREHPDLLTFDPAMLTHDAAAEVTEQDYPEQWVAEGGLTFDLAYHFEPGAADDGITIDVPVAVLNRVGDEDFSWNVPGLREELVTELLRSLPKQLRVNFVPAPNTAREFLAAVPAGEEPLLDALERYLRSTTGVHVPREAWGLDALAPHLRPTYRVVDDKGREQARGKDLTALKAPLRRASSGRWRRSPRTVVWRGPGRPRGRSARSTRRPPGPAPATRWRRSPGSSTRGSRSGSRSSGRPPSATRGTG